MYVWVGSNIHTFIIVAATTRGYRLSRAGGRGITHSRGAFLAPVSYSRRANAVSRALPADIHIYRIIFFAARSAAMYINTYKYICMYVCGRPPKRTCPHVPRPPKRPCPPQNRVPRNTIIARTCTRTHVMCAGLHDGGRHSLYTTCVGR